MKPGEDGDEPGRNVEKLKKKRDDEKGRKKKGGKGERSCAAL